MTDLDLTPDVAGTNKGTGSTRNKVIIAVVLVGLGAVLYKAVTSASVYFYNVDEAIAQQAVLGTETFRMQGVVATEPETAANGDITFELEFNGQRADIFHIGAEPTDLFEVGIPVVAEGHWEGGRFVSSQLLVKHSEAYVADNPDRVDAEIEQRVQNSSAEQ